MRFLTKSAALFLTLIFTGALGLDLAYAQNTNLDSNQKPTNSSATDNTDFVADIISAAEKRGVQVIVINGAPQEDTTSDANTANSSVTGIPSGVISADDYDNLNMTMAPASASAVMRLQSSFLSLRTLVKHKIEQVPSSIINTRQIIERNSPSGDFQPYIRALFWSIVLLSFGALVEHQIYIKRIVARWLEPDLKEHPVGYLEKFPLLIKRALLKILGVILSVIIAFTTGSVVFRATPPESIQFTIAVIYIGYGAYRLLRILWRTILAPYLSQYRIPPFSDADATRLFHWLWIVSSINILVLMIGIWLVELGGESDIHAVLASFFSFIVAMANILMVVVNREALSRAIRAGKDFTQVGTFTKFLSKFWLLAAIGYFAFSWLQLTYHVALDQPLSTPLTAGAYGILLAIICVYALANYCIELVSFRSRKTIQLRPEEDANFLLNTNDPLISDPLISDQNSATDDGQSDTVMFRHPLTTYEDLARRVSGILAIGAGLWALTRIWHAEHLDFYRGFFERSTDALAILFFGYIIYHIVRIWIDNKIQEEGGDTALAPGDEGGATGASRLATLLPLFRNFMLVVIGMSVLFSALLELGINVSPLFASAGVVGLAIGFGAQTLVRDIFSGAFYLFDDAFRRGEYVDIGSVKGTVEKISVRSFQLRHHLGPLHTIPFGEIQSLTNYSRDWVMMKLPLRLTYDTDPEKVRKLVKKLGQELMADPEIGDTFLQPLKSQGVIEMQDSAMIVRVKFMAKPGDQWTIRKRVYQEIRNLFHREGIHFANKEVTVRLAGETPDKLTEKQTQTIAAAAVDFEEDDGASTSDDDR